MATTRNAAGDAITKLLRKQVEDLSIDAGLKKLFLYIFDNADALMDFARHYAAQKVKGKVRPDELMMGFLKDKGTSLANFGVSLSDQESLSDAWAVFSLVLNVKESAKYSSGGPFGVALTIGFLINDAGEFLANFSPAQRAYYEHFLTTASVAVRVPVDPALISAPSSSGRRTIRCY